MTGPALDSLENQNTSAFLFSVLFKTQYCGWSMMPSGAHIMTGNIPTHKDMGHFFSFHFHFYHIRCWLMLWEMRGTRAG